jgi:predicted alpha/beta-fold hydrolase
LSPEKTRPPSAEAARARPSPVCAFQPSRFRAAAWLRGAHGQTIAGRLLRRAKPQGLTRVRVDTPDGDFLDLDIVSGARPGRPLVLLLHGLEGSARRGYALNMYRALDTYGVAAVGLNFRGCSGDPNRLRRSYHSGETGDLRFVLDVLARRFPDSPLGIIGFSLGGNVLLKWLGEEGAAAVPRVLACVAVSVPFDLGVCATTLESTFMGRFYMRRFLATLLQKTEAKSAILGDQVDLARVRRARNFREFDDAATAPLHGFADAADYYARSSSAGFLARVRVPTLLVQAEDDPFFPIGAMPWEAIRANPCLQPVVVPGGGHVGFVTGTPWAPRFWLEEEASRYLAQQLHAAGGRTP